jgi:predicted dehydrogenase
MKFRKLSKLRQLYGKVKLCVLLGQQLFLFTDRSVMLFYRRYMLRYLKAVQMMKEIIEQNDLTVMATIARYACAYEAIAKPDWWDKSRRFDPNPAICEPPTYPLVSAGPIVEQGTHFCDLSRYFGGDVDISTVAAHSLEWYESAGHLSAQVIDESKIAPENRIPRITSATWYDSTSIG